MKLSKTAKIVLFSVGGLAVVLGGFFGIRYIMKSSGSGTNTGGGTNNGNNGGGGLDPSDIIDIPLGTDDTEPTNEQFILMGDRELSWDRLYTLGDNLGFSKTEVNDIVKNGRATFNTTVAVKFPDWIQRLKDICAEYGITVKATPGLLGFAK